MIDVTDPIQAALLIVASAIVIVVAALVLSKHLDD